jgi:O-antigen/teichoic acid export membrane protein
MKYWLWRALQGTALAVIAELLSRMSNTIFFILLTWQTTPVEASTFSISFVYTGLLTAFCLGGLEQLLNCEASHDLASSRITLGNFLLARAFTAIIIYGGLFLWLVKYSAYDQYTVLVIGLLGSIIIPESFTNLFQSFFIAANRVHYIVGLNALTGLARVCLGAALIVLGGNSATVAVVVVVTSWMGMLIAFLLVGKHFFWPSISLQKRLWKHYVRAETPLFLMALMAALEGNFDSLLLSGGGSNDIILVGSYSAAATILNALLIIPNTLRQIILSIFSATFYMDREKSLRLYMIFMRIALYGALFCCLLITFIAPEIVSMMYRQSFVLSIPILQVLIWSFLWTMLLVPNGRLMLTAGIQHRAVLPQLAGVLLNVGLNLALQPTFSVIGAAIAKVCSAALVFWWCFWIVRWEIYSFPIGSMVWPAVGTTIITIIFFLLNDWLHFSWVIEVIIGTFVYIFSLCLLGGFQKEELQAFWHFLRIRDHRAIRGEI